MHSRPARPRDAATLVAWRKANGRIEVLMGRRAARHRFVPHHYVFPGGRLDAADFRAPVATPLRQEVEQRLCGHCRPSLARALAIAAARETFEETGLSVGGAVPRLDCLDFVMRAITPASSPIRFHARFFAVEASHLSGDLAGNGELLDLAWRPVEECLRLPIVDVTEYLLRRLASGTPLEGGTPQLYSFRNGRILVR